MGRAGELAAIEAVRAATVGFEGSFDQNTYSGFRVDGVMGSLSRYGVFRWHCTPKMFFLSPAGCGSALVHQYFSSTKLSDMSAFIC